MTSAPHRLWIALATLLASCTGAGASGGELGLRLVDAFPEHPDWQRPLLFTAAPGDEGWHVVGLQRGEVMAFRVDADGRASEPEVWLDIRDATSRRGNEEGLLDVAFHPDFANNGRLFVHHSLAGEREGRVVEFRAPEGFSAPVDRTTGRTLLAIDQPYRNHNGGELEFGPDGMLYLGLGDGGSAGDPEGRAQDLGTLLGKLLRIDVDGESPGLAYAIPPDNPFADVDGARGEIWALGLRNPWRFSFDPATGELWVGDVGQLRFEEIDVVTRGGNYGWRRLEGFEVYDAGAAMGPNPPIDPVLAYPRSEGTSVTGGHVYRGERVEALRGQYVYGDYGSGRVWMVPAAAPSDTEPVLLFRCERPASFGRDARGELYVCSFDGRIYRIESAQ